MNQDSNPLMGVSFLNKHGFCLNCDSPITKGIFCKKCAPYIPDDTTTVSSMSENITFYASPGSLFEADGLLWILSKAILSPHKDRYYTAKIRKFKGAIKLDSRSIDRDDIYFGWPDYDENTPCFLVHLTNI